MTTGITFWSGKKEYKSLSNFWECEVVIIDDGIQYMYNSGEHCFHGEKYRKIGKLCEDIDRMNQLLEYSKLFLKDGKFPTALKAKSAGGKKGLELKKNELDLWSKICLDVQYNICNYKFDNYEEVRTDLKKSIGSLLIHSASRCSEKQYEKQFWAGKLVERDGIKIVIGGNKLGECWMEIRDRMVEG